MIRYTEEKDLQVEVFFFLFYVLRPDDFLFQLTKFNA